MINLLKAGVLAGSLAVGINLHAQGQKRPAASQTSLVSISPISLSANTAGLEITSKVLERWSAQADVPVSHLQVLGLRTGSIFNPQLFKSLEWKVGDRAQNFVEIADRAVFRLGRPQQSQADFGPAWEAIAREPTFIADAVYFGGFGPQDEQRLQTALQSAAQDKGPNSIAASTTAYKMLSDARLSALRVARGYKQLYEILGRELQQRESVKNISMVFEVRAKGREQATISPLSRVSLNCAGQTKATLVFAQRKRDCNEFGVCRVESSTEVADNSTYDPIFRNLAMNGRQFLDGCILDTSMLIDGEEVLRVLPGKFTSHVPLVTQ